MGPLPAFTLRHTDPSILLIAHHTFTHTQHTHTHIHTQDGKVRLYNDKSLARANTAIPGLGAPITAIDVTHDGKWVLATTDKYLMVVKTTYDNGKVDSPSGAQGVQ